MDSAFSALRKEILEQEFSHLNPEQRRAVFAVNGPVLILAGAGSGKTTVLANRIAYMVKYGDAFAAPDGDAEALCEARARGDGEAAAALLRHNPIRPYHILAITFTNKAAGELRERIERQVGPAGRDVHAATFHSSCVRILRRDIERLGYQKNFTIYDTDDSVRIVKECLREMRADDKMYAPKAVFSVISKSKNNAQGPDVLRQSGDFRASTIAGAFELYQKRLRANNAVDFDDILLLTAELFAKNPDVLEHYQSRFRYICVDEYQDTNLIQYRIVSMLAARHHNLCVVGDDDQSIYRFRGADITNILEFETQFPAARVIKLEQNYRSTGNILGAANAVIANNQGRKPKALWTAAGSGEKVIRVRAVDELDESEFIARTVEAHVAAGGQYRDNAVLYRIGAQSRGVERYFTRAGIPYRIVGGTRFEERMEIKDVTAYLGLIANPHDNLRLRRVIAVPRRGIGESSLDKCQEIALGLSLPMLDICRSADEFPALSRSARAMRQFAALIDDLRASAQSLPISELYTEMLQKTGYTAHLEAQGEEGLTRLENTAELMSMIREFERDAEDVSLEAFLEEFSLHSDLDDLDGDDYVTLMTLHAAKGLEYDNIFIAGFEEGIFPGARSMYDQAELEEERRLAYVGITRAKKHLYCITAESRMLFGQTMRGRPSRFLEEVPAALCDSVDRTERLSAQMRRFTAGGSASRGPGGTGADSARTVGGAPKTDPAEVDFAPGDTVLHRVFGEGLVLSMTPMGGDILVEIAFSRAGTKKIMANFAKLQKKS